MDNVGKAIALYFLGGIIFAVSLGSLLENDLRPIAAMVFTSGAVAVIWRCIRSPQERNDRRVIIEHRIVYDDRSSVDLIAAPPVSTRYTYEAPPYAPLGAPHETRTAPLWVKPPE